MVTDKPSTPASAESVASDKPVSARKRAARYSFTKDSQKHTLVSLCNKHGYAYAPSIPVTAKGKEPVKSKKQIMEEFVLLDKMAWMEKPATKTSKADASDSDVTSDVEEVEEVNLGAGLYVFVDCCFLNTNCALLCQ
jgi:hypothetical protein